MQKLFYRRSKVWEYLMLIVGTALVAASIQCIYDPISLVTGGFSGLAIVIKSVTEPFFPGGVPLWFTNIALNIPVFLVAFKVKVHGLSAGPWSAHFSLSAWLYVLPAVDLTQGETMSWRRCLAA